MIPTFRTCNAVDLDKVFGVPQPLTYNNYTDDGENREGRHGKDGERETPTCRQRHDDGHDKDRQVLNEEGHFVRHPALNVHDVTKTRGHKIRNTGDCLSMCPSSLCSSVHLSVCLFNSRFVCLFISRPYVCPPACHLVYSSVCPAAFLSVNTHLTFILDAVLDSQLSRKVSIYMYVHI